MVRSHHGPYLRAACAGHLKAADRSRLAIRLGSIGKTDPRLHRLIRATFRRDSRAPEPRTTDVRILHGSRASGSHVLRRRIAGFAIAAMARRYRVEFSVTGDDAKPDLKTPVVVRARYVSRWTCAGTACAASDRAGGHYRCTVGLPYKEASHDRNC